MNGLLGFRERDFAGGQAKAARVGFGQSVMVTPLALASAYGAIANGGRLVRPRLVSAYQHPDGRIARSFPPVVVRRVLTPEVAAKMSECLAAVCEEGTGKGARIPGYTTAGKTGTAQKVVEGTRGYAPGKYVSSFIGYVPARNPRAVIAVVVNEPKNGYYGAQIAGPVFKAIGQRVLCYWKAPADRLGESDKF
jgi:cell division protein FtsI/penicillin-binding protein 2